MIEDDKEHEECMGCPKAEPRNFYKQELFIGQGGNGKTHLNLFDEGLINAVYVAPSWKLTTEKLREIEKYDKNIDCIVHQRLFFDPYSKQEKYISRWNNYIIDEASMIIEGLKQYVFENVKGKIIFCGDLNYQLPPVITPEMKKAFGEDAIEMTTDGFDNVRTLTKNYRVKCNKLMKLLTYIRAEIKCVKDEYINYGHNTEYVTMHQVTKILKKECNVITKKQINDIYTKKDLIICSEKVLMNEFTEQFKHIQKYRVLDNTRDYCNGDIIFEKVKKVRSELRHGFTIHSVQGITIPEGQYLFIDLRRMKSLRMLYTALSRARYLSQIYIIQ